MAARAIGSGTISFGLVSIPVRLYAAVSPKSVSFHLLHEKCGSRIKLQNFCPVCRVVVERGELVRGYEFAKDQYVRFTDEELKALEEETTRVIELSEFVPLDRVDPLYFDRGYFLGPDKGGEKAYRLLAEAMAKSGRAALAQFVMRGKGNLVLIRAAGGGLLLHTLYYADELRDASEIDRAQGLEVKPAELNLALKLMDELSSDEFHPEHYQDIYRERVLELANSKIEGKEVTAAPARAERAQVIDLMEALKKSLAAGAEGKARRAARGAAARVLRFEDFQSSLQAAGLRVGEKELRRSYEGLMALRDAKKLSWEEVREKLAQVERDLRLTAAPGESARKTKTLRAARLPVSLQDWSRY